MNHYDNGPMQYKPIFTAVKHDKIVDLFLIIAQNIDYMDMLARCNAE